MDRYLSPPFVAPLVIVAVLKATMLAALYSGTPPHPPNAITLFAIAPFLGASIAVALAAAMFGSPRSRTGRTLAALAALAALVSFGPHKFLDPNFALIWPAVLTGQAAALWSIFGIVRAHRQESQDGLPAGSKA